MARLSRANQATPESQTPATWSAGDVFRPQMSREEGPASAGGTAPPDVAALVAGLFTVTVWGSAFVGIRAAGAEFSPGSLALGRLLVGCLILGGAAAIRRDPLPSRRDLALIAVYGVLWLAVYSTSL